MNHRLFLPFLGKFDMNVIDGSSIKVAKFMQMMESTKIIVYSLIQSDGKTDQSDESSNGGQGGGKWSKLIKLTQLQIRVPH